LLRRIDTDDLKQRKPDSFTGPAYNHRRTIMNSFDLAACVALVIAVYSGFATGLLRSGITILAYLLAMPLAMGVVAAMSPQLQDVHGTPLAQNWLQFFAAFVVIGVALGKIGRILLDEAVGSEAGFGDRLAGALLGAVRIGMVATTLVLVFDRLVPAERQPLFLEGSRLRPLLSLAGAKGFRSLPPEVASLIDRLKQERRI
jgi:membrane protein required for colicin V production